MTTGAAILSLFQRFSPSVVKATTDSILVLNGIDPSSEYVADEMKCKLYGYLLSFLSTNPDYIATSVSEGGYSITYGEGGIKNWFYNIALESGCKGLILKYAPGAVINDKSNVW